MFLPILSLLAFTYQLTHELKPFIDSSPHLAPYQSISQKRLYQLFIDQEQWERAERTECPDLFFDQLEPGYLSAMIHAFIYLHAAHRALSSPMLLELHDLAVHEVINKEGALFKKGFRFGEDSFVTFSLRPFRTVTVHGRQELWDKWNSTESNYNLEIGPNGEKENLFRTLIHPPMRTTRLFHAMSLSLKPIYQMDLPLKCIDLFISQYEEELRYADDPLPLIATLVQNLEQIHPFYDGNIRTFAILFLNKLLLDNNLPPCCLANPNCIDCLSIEEIVLKIREGQEHFRQLTLQ